VLSMLLNNENATEALPGRPFRSRLVPMKLPCTTLLVVPGDNDHTRAIEVLPGRAITLRAAGVVPPITFAEHQN